MSLTDQPRGLDLEGDPEPSIVALRLAHVRVGVAFICRTAAEGLLPALSHALEDPSAPTDTTLVVRRRVEDVAELLWWERAAPLREPLARVLGAEGCRVVHAAVVGDDRGAVALVGPRTSGKTTAAVAAVRGGLDFVGDDYVLLRMAAPFEAVSLYSTISVRSGDGDGTKRIEQVGSLRSGALRRSLPLRAIAVPRISGGETGFSPLEPAAVLRAWAPSTVNQMTDDGGAALPLLSAAVRSLPCYTLDVGVESSAVAAAVGELLNRAGAQA